MVWGERGEGVEEEEGARVCGRSGDAEGEKPVLWFKTTFFFLSEYIYYTVMSESRNMKYKKEQKIKQVFDVRERKKRQKILA